MKKGSNLKWIIVIILCLAILLPFFGRSIFAGHHCNDEHCKICEFLRVCDSVRDNFKPIIDEVRRMLSDLKFMKALLPEATIMRDLTLTGLHVRMDD